MEWGILPFKRYADFSGRSRRIEYWMFILLLSLLSFILSFILVMLALHQATTGSTFIPMSILPPILIAILLAIFIPSIAVQVRRFHDLDKSGWFILLNFIPFIGGIIVFVLMCMEGTRGPNRFGEDPKA